MAGPNVTRLPLAAKFGIGIAVLGLVGAAYFVVFYGDLASRINAERTKEKQLRDQLEEARKAEFLYQADLAELADRQQRQRELNKILPSTTEYPAFLSQIQSVANVTGVSLSAWTPHDEVREQFYSRVPMKLELSGKYHQVAKFFYGVGQLDRIINMENISIIQPRREGDDVIVKVESLATAFRALGEAEAAAPASGKKKGKGK